MENNDNMMEELQNVSQPESLPEIAVVEAPEESEPESARDDDALAAMPHSRKSRKRISGLNVGVD